ERAGERPRGQARILPRLAGQPLHQVADGLMEARRGREPMIELPAHLRRHVAAVEIGAGPPAELLRPHALAQLRERGIGAPVHPDEARSERLAAGVDRHRAIELARDPDGGDIALAPAGRRHPLPPRRAEGCLPQLRLLLGPSRLREGDRIAAGATAGQPQPAVQQHDLQTLAADIDAEEHKRRPRLPPQVSLARSSVLAHAARMRCNWLASRPKRGLKLPTSAAVPMVKRSPPAPPMSLMRAPAFMLPATMMVLSVACRAARMRSSGLASVAR